MKKLFFILFALSLAAGCGKLEDPYVEDFKYTDCTKGDTDGDPEIPDLSLLTLKYENGDLLVLRTDAMLNCSFQKRGLVCTVSVKGSDIYYRVDYENEGSEVKCVCKVESISSLVKGLEPGKKYAFHYYCLQNYVPFSFTFKEGLISVVDVNTIMP